MTGFLLLFYIYININYYIHIYITIQYNTMEKKIHFIKYKAKKVLTPESSSATLVDDNDCFGGIVGTSVHIQYLNINIER